jgi:hypothetical protein
MVYFAREKYQSIAFENDKHDMICGSKRTVSLVYGTIRCTEPSSFVFSVVSAGYDA